MLFLTHMSAFPNPEHPPAVWVMILYLISASISISREIILLLWTKGHVEVWCQTQWG